LSISISKLGHFLCEGIKEETALATVTNGCKVLVEGQRLILTGEKGIVNEFLDISGVC
jgi:hypothetical protein